MCAKSHYMSHFWNNNASIELSAPAMTWMPPRTLITKNSARFLFLTRSCCPKSKTSEVYRLLTYSLYKIDFFYFCPKFDVRISGSDFLLSEIFGITAYLTV